MVLFVIFVRKITKSTVLFHKYTKSRNKKFENFAKFFFSKFCLFIYYLLIVDLSRCLIELLLSVILSRAKRRKWKMNFYFLKKSSFPAKVSRKVEICFFSAGHQILRKSHHRNNLLKIWNPAVFCLLLYDDCLYIYFLIKMFQTEKQSN